MIEKMSNYIVNNLLSDDEEIDADKKEVMLFGITRIIEDIPKFVAIFFMCYLLNILKEVGFVLVVTILYKIFVGGAHARTNIGCFIVSSMYFISPVFLARYTNFNLSFFYILTLLTVLLSVYVIVKRAPADTEEIPIINKEKRKRMKVYASISLILIITLTIIFIKDMLYMKIIIYTLIIINIFTLPLSYKLFRCKLGSESDEYADLYK